MTATVPAPAYKLAVVVPCFNCAGVLERCVASVLESARACPQCAGVFLVDGGSTDATPDLCARLASTHPQVTVLRHAVSTASAKRNHAMRTIDADYLVFTDPDCVATPAWLPELARAMGRWRCCAGRVTPLGEGLGTAVRLGSQNRTFRPGIWNRATAFRAATSNNMMIARTLLEAIGGFPEDIGPGTANGVAEDTEAAYKILRAGVPIRFLANAEIAHEPVKSEQAFLDKKAAYAYGVHYFMACRHACDPATWLSLFTLLAYSAARLLIRGPINPFQRRWAWIELRQRLQGFRHGWHARAAGKSD